MAGKSQPRISGVIIFTAADRQWRNGKLTWTDSSPQVSRLKQQGYKILQYPHLKKKIQAVRNTGASRSSLGNPAGKIMKIFQTHCKLAICTIGCQSEEDLFLIYSYLVEPAFRRGCKLILFADLSWSQLLLHNFPPDNKWRYHWTRERLEFLIREGRQPSPVEVAAPVNIWSHLRRILPRRGDIEKNHPADIRLDAQQKAAVNAGDGVVQVIAPAGSGKTTVLIQRVKELIRRGTSPDAILCMSFNRDAKTEIGGRLEKAGIHAVVVRSFHGMSLAILKNENRLRGGIGGLSDDQLLQIIGKVMDQREGQQSPSITEARNFISNFKLSAMISPAEALQKSQTGGPEKQIEALIFQQHEKQLAHLNLLDFDDLVARAVSLLQTDKAVRQRWQSRFTRVLVDEYQDIEPSQALLVGILAAPQDSLFCVGDEDQCIYAWRRATVQRIIELDQVYPGLERHALINNYRCGRSITRASRNLIRHNRIRFDKPLQAGSPDPGRIILASFPSRSISAVVAARLIHGGDSEKMALLARTSRLLMEVTKAYEKLYRSQPAIELATIHGAKGREWDRVIIFGADEGQTPHGRSSEEESIEDERRLFYVALTRARLQLEIISTREIESRFLKEAGLR